MAAAKAEGEFEKFQVGQLTQPTEVEKHFDVMLKGLNEKRRSGSARRTGRVGRGGQSPPYGGTRDAEEALSLDAKRLSPKKSTGGKRGKRV